MRIEVARDRDRVLDMARHPQRQRLEPLQEQEGVERAHRRAEIAQRFGPQLHQVAVGAERLVELQSVVGGRRLGDHRKAPVGPVEPPESTTTPPMLVPWPPMNFVAE